MKKEQIQALLENASDDFLERFYETLLNEINCDDEPYHKKARQLLLASLNDEHHDDFFIAICGWSLESIIEIIWYTFQYLISSISSSVSLVYDTI